MPTWIAPKLAPPERTNAVSGCRVAISPLAARHRRFLLAPLALPMVVGS
jgi:hypothetical protein